MSTTKKVKVNELANEIMTMFIDYIDEIDEEVVSLSDTLANQAKKDLKASSPKKDGDYAKGWAISQHQRGKRYYGKAIHNKEEYRLTHLLEFGHATKDGKRTQAYPHIRPVESKYKQKFVDELERKIKR